MLEIFFYHLETTKLNFALPPILEKCLEKGWNVVIQSTSSDRIAALDNDLWSYRDDSFLPHSSTQDESAEFQPILLRTDNDRSNSPQVRVLLDDARVDDMSGYERIVYMFDGHDEEMVQKARQFWKEVKESKVFKPTYWQQTQQGQWQKKE